MSESAAIQRPRFDVLKASPVVVPGVMIRALGALLALTIATAHVADQGGVTLFTSPGWLGWSFRLIEVGGVLTALALAVPRLARVGWVAGVALGAAPFLGYLASRIIGVPGDAVDVGNWSDWVGTSALIVEAALVTLSLAMLLLPDAERPHLEPPVTPSRAAESASLLDALSLWLPMNPK